MISHSQIQGSTSWDSDKIDGNNPIESMDFYNAVIVKHKATDEVVGVVVCTH